MATDPGCGMTCIVMCISMCVVVPFGTFINDDMAWFNTLV